MKFLSENKIEVDRELSDLDLFVLDFVRILRKHIRYVIVSGYVSILLGRARASEDVDIIIPEMDKEKFNELINETIKNGFYCLKAEENEDIYKQIRSSVAVRFAKKSTVIPNIELKFSKTKIDEEALNKKIIICINENELLVSPLELQIVFKEMLLKSPKDMEDARHIRNIAKNYLKPELIKKYQSDLHGYYKSK